MFKSRKVRANRFNPLFQSRTEVWRQVGLGEEIDRGGAQKARGGALVLLILIAGVLKLQDGAQLAADVLEVARRRGEDPPA